MSKPAKFRFVLQTSHPSNRTSELLLAETDNNDRAAQLRTKVMLEAGTLNTGHRRRQKRVIVTAVDDKRFRVFSSTVKPPRAGETFESIEHLAARMEASPLSLRSRISHYRKKNKIPSARKVRTTLRGVTYGYL